VHEVLKKFFKHSCTIAETHNHCGPAPWEGFSKRKPEDLPVPHFITLLSGEKQQLFWPFSAAHLLFLEALSLNM